MPLTQEQLDLWEKDMEEWGDECDRHEEKMYFKVFSQ